jgi:hypothetical protein
MMWAITCVKDFLLVKEKAYFNHDGLLVRKAAELENLLVVDGHVFGKTAVAGDAMRFELFAEERLQASAVKALVAPVENMRYVRRAEQAEAHRIVLSATTRSPTERSFTFLPIS